PMTNAVNSNFRIEPEPNRGKILLIESNLKNEGQNPFLYENRIVEKKIGNFWSLRQPQNAILRIEFEVYYHYSYIDPIKNRAPRINLVIESRHESIERAYDYGVAIEPESLLNNKIRDAHLGRLTVFNPIPYVRQNVWETIIYYVDFSKPGSSENIYIELPRVNFVTKGAYNGASLKELREDQEHTLFIGVVGTDNYIGKNYLKVDNINISAVNTLPTLSNEEFLSSKFNLFPNPTHNKVTIINNESIGIEQVNIVDLSGKLIKTQMFNKESNVQVDISDLASGMYMFNIFTLEGLLVKKVVKK
ncbi:MAG TPA: T9SS type A sorting domain-containing protein, partial [Flavobacterium sp.]|nr:T9SS type A sorting domain-containing protein [Flavobacterium sp.]